MQVAGSRGQEAIETGGGGVMYTEFLGEGYCDKIRKMLTVDDEFLPDEIINAEANIGGMKQLVAPILESAMAFGNLIDTEDKYKNLQDAAVYYLCGILCMAMESRSSAPPYNIKKYQKRWGKKQKKYMQKGNEIMVRVRHGDSV